MIGTGCRCCLHPVLNVRVESNVDDVPGLVWDPKLIGVGLPTDCPHYDFAPFDLYGDRPFPGESGARSFLTYYEFDIAYTHPSIRNQWSGSVALELRAVYYAPTPPPLFGFPCCGTGPVTFSANIIWAPTAAVNTFPRGENPQLRQSFVVTPQRFTGSDVAATQTQAVCQPPTVATIELFDDGTFEVNALP